MEYGILDTQDNCWMGDNDAGDGPRLFDDEAIARVAAQVMDVQLGWKTGRCRAKEFNADSLRLRDKVDAKMDGLTALDGLESGRFI